MHVCIKTRITFSGVELHKLAAKWKESKVEQENTIIANGGWMPEFRFSHAKHISLSPLQSGLRDHDISTRSIHHDEV